MSPVADVVEVPASRVTGRSHLLTRVKEGLMIVREVVVLARLLSLKERGVAHRIGCGTGNQLLQTILNDLRRQVREQRMDQNEVGRT